MNTGVEAYQFKNGVRQQKSAIGARERALDEGLKHTETPTDRRGLYEALGTRMGTGMLESFLTNGLGSKGAYVQTNNTNRAPF